MLVKVSIGGAASHPDISQFVGNQYNRIGDVEFAVNDPDTRVADVWIVLESPEAGDVNCDSRRVVFAAAETMWNSGREAESEARQRYLHQFDTIYTYQDLYWPNVEFSPPFLPWMINANHGASIFAGHPRDLGYLRGLRDLDKPEKLSVICSTKTYTEGHRLRLRFVEALAHELGDQLAWYGNGRRPVDEKWDAIAPYQFHLAIENQSSYGVFTEKLLDAYLGLSHPIYFGAPDIDRYFPAGSLTSINIRDFKGSVDTIRTALEVGLSQADHLSLLEAKAQVLDRWNLFKRMADLAQQEARRPSRPASTHLRMPPRDVARWRMAGSRAKGIIQQLSSTGSP